MLDQQRRPVPTDEAAPDPGLADASDALASAAVLLADDPALDGILAELGEAERAGEAVPEPAAAAEPAEEHDREILVQASTNLLGMYLAQVNRIQKTGGIPLLSQPQEYQLFSAIRNLREEKRQLEKNAAQSPALEQVRKDLVENTRVVILANLRLVISIAKRYQNLGMPFLDLIEEGNVGLIEAVNRFDPERGVRFSTYGIWWIRQAIIKALTEKGRMIRIPMNILNRVKDIVRASSELAQSLGREPTIVELADRVGMPRSRIIELLRFAQEPGSLETPVDQSRSVILGDLIEDKAQEAAPDAILVSSLREVIASVLARLDAKEREVLRLRFGLDGYEPHTLEETGHELGLTRERVRQIQEKALNRIKGMRVARELREFFQ